MHRVFVTGTSSSHQRVKAEFLPSMTTIIPPRELIETYTRLAAPVFQRVASNLTQSQALAAIRDTLLPKLMSGEIRLRDVRTSHG